MRFDDEISSDYFEWLFEIIDSNRYSRHLSYRRLVEYLHDTEFIILVPRDEGRAKDGAKLRYRFALSHGFNHVPSCLEGPCSVLEMMVALAIRCEEDYMHDCEIGDRTGQWFWGMITSMGLGAMYDVRFDEMGVEETVMRFLYREYEPDGRGGLFTLRHPRYDMRNIEIWRQLMDYLNEIA